jgi:DNA-binding CsgD family transcriptional regulator
MGDLLEREDATARLQESVSAAARGRGGALVIEGPAGIGKTSMLAHADDIAGAAGGEVRRARTGPLEAGLAWNVVRQLFADVVSDGAQASAELLAGASALAAPALGLAGGGDEGALHGLYWLTADLASRKAPLVLVVDDAQWADATSLRFLAYLARRIEDLPVLIMLAVRFGERHDETLDVIAVEPSTKIVRLHELTVAGSEKLARASLGTEAAKELCEACHQASGGNPFLLGELVGELRRERADVADPRSLAVVEALRPETVTRVVLLRLARLPDDARAVAQAAAVLGAGASLGHVASLAGISEDRAQRGVRTLIDNDILRSSPLDFVHPIVHRVVAAELGPVGLAHAHATAARILADTNAAPDHVAAHLLNAEPTGDAWVVERLRHGARSALESGAAETACSYLRRALEETPQAELRGPLLYELGIAEARAGLGGTDQMRAALELSVAPRERAEIALRLGHALGLAGHHVEAADVLEAGLAEPHDDPALGGLLEGELAGQALHAAAKLEVASRLVARVNFDGPSRTPGEHRLRVIAAHALLGHLPPDHARTLAFDAAASYLPSNFDDLATLLFVAELLIYVDELDRAIEILDTQIAASREHGSLPAAALASAFRAQAGLRRGNLGEAEADARAALGVLGTAELGYSRSYVLSFLIDVLVELDELDEADEVLALAGPGDQWPQIWQSVLLARSAARLRIAQVRGAEGLELMRECAARAAPWEARNPSVLPWRGDLALALATNGDRAAALELTRAELEDARRITVPRGLGISLRARGVVERGPAAIELLREAVTVLEQSVSRLEHARALIDLGAALRRAGTRLEARERLHAGLDAARRCGARALVSRARSELQAAGGRLRAEPQDAAVRLTPSELRVVQLAASGRTNREVAQALFVSLRTVETHLTHVYQKLDLSSRHELPAALKRMLEGSASGVGSAVA